MKIFITTILSLLSFAINADPVCPKLNANQIASLKFSYEYGEKYALGLTLAAIALKESSAGEWKINAMTSDYGMYHGNFKTICKQAGVFHSAFECNMEIQQVVENDTKAAKHAIETLTYYRNYHKKRNYEGLVYELMIRSYNRGWSFNDAGGDKYWKEFKTNFYQVKECGYLI